LGGYWPAPPLRGAAERRQPTVSRDQLLGVVRRGAGVPGRADGPRNGPGDRLAAAKLGQGERGRVGAGDAFPTRWDRFFIESMSLLDVYHYATEHFDFHRAQLNLAEAP
jgi:hypothetical protein